jgi:hypothetical protein
LLGTAINDRRHHTAAAVTFRERHRFRSRETSEFQWYTRHFRHGLLSTLSHAAHYARVSVEVEVTR